MSKSKTPKLDAVNEAIKTYNSLVETASNDIKTDIQTKINNNLITLKAKEDVIKDAEKQLRIDKTEGKIPVQLRYRHGSIDPTNTGTEFIKILEGVIETETEYVKKQIRTFVDEKLSKFYTTHEKLIKFQEDVLNFKKEVNRIFKEDPRSDTKFKIQSGGSGEAKKIVEFNEKDLQNELTNKINTKKQKKEKEIEEYNKNVSKINDAKKTLRNLEKEEKYIESKKEEAEKYIKEHESKFDKSKSPTLTPTPTEEKRYEEKSAEAKKNDIKLEEIRRKKDDAIKTLEHETKSLREELEKIDNDTESMEKENATGSIDAYKKEQKFKKTFLGSSEDNLFQEIDKDIIDHYNEQLGQEYKDEIKTKYSVNNNKLILLQKKNDDSNIIKQFENTKTKLETALKDAYDLIYFNVNYEMTKNSGSSSDFSEKYKTTNEISEILNKKIENLIIDNPPDTNPRDTPPQEFTESGSGSGEIKIHLYKVEKFVNLITRVHKTNLKKTGYLDAKMRLLKSIMNKDATDTRKMSMSKYLIREQYKKLNQIRKMFGAYIPEFFAGFQEVMRIDLEKDRDNSISMDKKMESFYDDPEFINIFGDVNIIKELYKEIKEGIQKRTGSNEIVTPDEDMCHKNIGFAFNKKTTDMLNKAVSNFESDLDSSNALGLGSGYGCKVRKDDDEDNVDVNKKQSDPNEDESRKILNQTLQLKKITNTMNPDKKTEYSETKKKENMKKDIKKSNEDSLQQHEIILIKHVFKIIRTYLFLLEQSQKTGCSNMFYDKDIESRGNLIEKIKSIIGTTINQTDFVVKNSPNIDIEESKKKSNSNEKDELETLNLKLSDDNHIITIRDNLKLIQNIMNTKEISEKLNVVPILNKTKVKLMRELKAFLNMAKNHIELKKVNEYINVKNILVS